MTDVELDDGSKFQSAPLASAGWQAGWLVFCFVFSPLRQGLTLTQVGLKFTNRVELPQYLCFSLLHQLPKNIEVFKNKPYIH